MMYRYEIHTAAARGQSYSVYDTSTGRFHGNGYLSHRKDYSYDDYIKLVDWLNDRETAIRAYPRKPKTKG